MDRYLKEQQEKTLKKLTTAIDNYNEKEDEVIEKFRKLNHVSSVSPILNFYVNWMIHKWSHIS